MLFQRLACRSIWISAVLSSLLSLFLQASPETNVAAIFELGMGARPLAMGGAFVGLADDTNVLSYNSAGLAWLKDLSVLSSYETRPAMASYGHISSAFSNFGFGIHYFDFGDVPETDESGNVVGTFSYRNYGFVAAAGVTAAELPLLNQIPVLQNLAVGVKAKFLKVSTLAPGSGSGFALDMPSLLWSGSLTRWGNLVTHYGFGISVENLLSRAIRYGSGHQENWERKAVIGSSLVFVDQVTLAMDVASDNCACFGIEWTPTPVLSLRGGLRQEGTWIWSLGLGMEFRNFTLDYAIVIHPHLSNQHRGSLTVFW